MTGEAWFFAIVGGMVALLYLLHRSMLEELSGEAPRIRPTQEEWARVLEVAGPQIVDAIMTLARERPLPPRDVTPSTSKPN